MSVFPLVMAAVAYVLFLFSVGLGIGFRDDSAKKRALMLLGLLIVHPFACFVMKTVFLLVNPGVAVDVSFEAFALASGMAGICALVVGVSLGYVLASPAKIPSAPPGASLTVFVRDEDLNDLLRRGLDVRAWQSDPGGRVVRVTLGFDTHRVYWDDDECYVGEGSR